MENKIKQLYKFVFDKAREVQHKTLSGEQIDGKAVWNSIEVKIKDIKLDINLEYNHSLYELYEKMDKIIEKYDLASNEFNPITNHFFLQLKNLVKTKSNFIIYINRVLQIAYNAGQLSVLLENNKLNDDIKQFTLQNNMLDLDTYVSTDNQNIINMKIHDHIISDVIADSNANSIQKGGNLYKLKYLKYKQKYLELKKILLGGVDVDLTVLYANVGADNVYDDSYKKMPYCQQTGTQIKDYEHREGNFSPIDPKEISELSLDNLKNAINKLIKQDIDVLMFCEFCFSQLHALIEYLNGTDTTNKYDILLIGQKRDDIIYGIINDSGVYKTDRDKIAINGYHPDATTPYGDKLGIDGYFKCFGYIYKKEKLIFNYDETRRQNRINNSNVERFKLNINEIDTLSKQDIYTGGISTSTPGNITVGRKLHICKIHDYDHKGNTRNFSPVIVECITQFSGLANFTVNGKSISMFVPHFSGIMEDTHWVTQYINLLKRMQILETNNKIIMIGDFNVRKEGKPEYYNTNKDNKDLIRIPSTNTIHPLIKQVSGENTLYLDKYMQISPEIIAQPQLNGNFVSAHKFIKLTLRIPDVEQPVPAVRAVPTVPEVPIQQLPWARRTQPVQPAQPAQPVPAQPVPAVRAVQPAPAAEPEILTFKRKIKDLQNLPDKKDYFEWKTANGIINYNLDKIINSQGYKNTNFWRKVCNFICHGTNIKCPFIDDNNLEEIKDALITRIKKK
jgi:hypothetical protein